MNKVTRLDMVKAAWSDPWVWRAMCERAKRNGWTYGQVMGVLIFGGPIAGIVYFGLLVFALAVLTR